MTRIDTHVHMIPPAYRERAERRGPFPWPEGTDMNGCLAAMDAMEITASAISLPLLVSGVADERTGPPSLARRCNEHFAEIVADAPKRFAALACLPLPDVEAALDEIRYALDDLKLDGIVLLTSYDDVYLGDSRFDAVMDELDRRSAYVFVHPTASADPLGQFFGPFFLELPFATTRAVMNLMFSGTLARCPDIRFQFAHMGGTAPYLVPRVNEVFARFPQAIELAPGGLTHLQHLYWDTGLAVGPAPIQAALSMTSIDKIVFGTDWPYDACRPKNGSDPAPGLAFLGADRAKVDGSNPLALLPRLAPD